MDERITVQLAGGKKDMKIKGVTAIRIPREIISNHLFERKPHLDPDIRYGIFAKVNITKGAILFQENVLCYAEMKDNATKQEFDAAKERAYNNLDETRKAMFDILNTVQIFDTNSFGGPRDGLQGFYIYFTPAFRMQVLWTSTTMVL